MARHTKRICLYVQGMHCASCELLIEKKLRKHPGVKTVHANQAKGTVKLEVLSDPNIAEINESLKPHGYVVSLEKGRRFSAKDFVEAGAIAIVLIGVYLLLKQLDIIPSIGLTDNMSYGLIFVMGLIAAISTCMAVTGGLVLALSAKYSEANPNASGLKRFVPHAYFNAGRVIGYTLFGALIGLIGSAIAINPETTGILTLIVASAMILLGLQMLGLFPWIRTPSFARKITENPKATRASAFGLGSASFFFPCGFTQALQLYVLATGNWFVGGITMMFFSLGTMPGLLGIGALGSFAQGNWKKWFVKTAAVAVVIVGVFSVSNGLVLAGVTGKTAAGPDLNAALDPNVKMENGVQIVSMKIDGYDYYPSRFTVTQGVPVDWIIDGSKAAGCAQVITSPKLGVTEYIPPNKGPRTIRFTPTETGFFPFSCTMGMTTPGAGFQVVAAAGSDAESGIVPVSASAGSGASSVGVQECDSSLQDCSIQHATIEVSKERGFYPDIIEVKNNIPVELEFDTKMKLGGCMSTMVIPEYDVAHRLTLGKSKVQFTPTRTGIFPMTCSMGGLHAQIKVV